MPRKSILTNSEKESLIDIPQNEEDLIRYYTFSENDFSFIKQHRGDANRLGFAIHLCYLRYPGQFLSPNQIPHPFILEIVAKQLNISAETWDEYGKREQTRRVHLQELQNIYKYRTFGFDDYQVVLELAIRIALQTDKGILIAIEIIEYLRKNSILLPSINVIERICSEALTKANRQIYTLLSFPLTSSQYKILDKLLKRKENSSITWMMWLKQSPHKVNTKSMLEHIEKLKLLQSIEIPEAIEHSIHQNRLLKIAREGSQMSTSDLAKFESNRRYATLVAICIEATATIIDEIIELHDKIIGKLFNIAKHKHEEKFQSSGKAINDKVHLYTKIGQALLEAKRSGSDPYVAIEKIISWDNFSKSVEEASKLAINEDFDFLHYIGENYQTVRRYIVEFLNVLKFRATPSSILLLESIDFIRKMYRENSRKITTDAPTAFIKKRWNKLIFTDDGIHRNYYEICLLSELKNALRSGDIWVQGSRQFKDFEDYLLSEETFNNIKLSDNLPLKIELDCEKYLTERISLIEERLKMLDYLSITNELPDAVITSSGLKITPLESTVPDNAQAFINKISSMLPHIKITELLLEVESWTEFSSAFTHLKTGEVVKDKILLLSVILADAINLGLNKMAESSTNATYTKLSWLQAWHIRDETYSKALAELVNAQLNNSFAINWGDGTTSSSDGQRFKAGNKAQTTGHINPKYGSEPGRLFYTHISDQYSAFSTKVVNVGIRDSTYVLDGLLYHESDLKIEEHYTDTAGFTDHVFALMHLLGFRFAPRIRDLADTKIYIPQTDIEYEGLKPMIGGTIKIKHIQLHWNEIIRLATSIKQGTVTASLMLRKLGSYPRQNGLALALRELGRIERSLFILDWLQNVDLRRRVNAGLNKGEARNALARAVFLNRLGELRDRSFDQQRYKASGLTLVTSAIVLWNTVYLERAVNTLKEQGVDIDESLLQYLSPLGWEHINLTGDYIWKKSFELKEGKFRPLRLKNFS